MNIANGNGPNESTERVSNGGPVKPEVLAAPSISQPELDDWEWQRLRHEMGDLGEAPKWAQRRVGVAVIGLGRMGIIHLNNLIREPQARLMYCFDSNLERLNSISKSMYFDQFNIKALAANQFDLALADPRVEAVIIATPSAYHEQLARQAIVANKNVLCEKPLTMKADSIEPLFEMARERRRFLLCAFNRRYDPEFRRLYERLYGSAGSGQSDARISTIRKTIGTPQLIHVTSRDGQRPSLDYVKVSGGLFHDSMIHEIDLCLWYARKLPTTIHVAGTTWREHFERDPSLRLNLSSRERFMLDTEIDDLFLAVVTLKFPNGTVGLLDNSRQTCYGYDQRCEIFATHGMATAGARRSLQGVLINDSGELHSNCNFTFASRYATAYRNELSDLLTLTKLASEGIYDEINQAEFRKYLIEANRPTLVLAASRVADACREAFKLGAPVKLNWTAEFEAKFERDVGQQFESEAWPN